jgi:non-heme chloroperoxidase
VVKDRSQFFKDLSLPFYGYNKAGAKVSEEVRESFWLQGIQSSIIGAYDCMTAFSETDQTEDLKKIDVPTLVIQGDAESNRAVRRLRAPQLEASQTRHFEGDRRGAAWIMHDACGCRQ